MPIVRLGPPGRVWNPRNPSRGIIGRGHAPHRSLSVNGHQALLGQRFTLAHEFGHHRMGHASIVDEQRAISRQLHDPQRFGRTFAAECLMPRDAVKAWARERLSGAVSLEHVVLLACKYGPVAGPRVTHCRTPTC